MADRAEFTAPRNRQLGLGLAIGLIGIGLGAVGWAASRLRGREGHAAPDLALDADRPGSDRAPDAFRPDPTAPVSAADREALRPATGPAPSIASDRGTMRSQTGPVDA